MPKNAKQPSIRRLRQEARRLEPVVRARLIDNIVARDTEHTPAQLEAMPIPELINLAESVADRRLLTVTLGNANDLNVYDTTGRWHWRHHLAEQRRRAWRRTGDGGLANRSPDDRDRVLLEVCHDL
jgi:hypothetical protein